MPDILRPTFVPNLSLISAGPVPPNPVELLTSQMFHDLLKQLRQDFDHLIVDTPPILGFADGRAISSHMDGVILVVKHHATGRDSVRLAAQLLFQVNAQLLGGVFNMAQVKKLGYGAYYGHYKQYAQHSDQSAEQKRLD